jgi:hypothetical protein
MALQVVQAEVLEEAVQVQRQAVDLVQPVKAMLAEAILLALKAVAVVEVRALLVPTAQELAAMAETV